MIRLAVRCPPELAEEVLAELLVLAPNGVEEDAGEGYVEYAIYGSPGEVPELGEVEAIAGEGLVSVSSAEVPDDWAERWRDFHTAVVIADRVVVRPSWTEPEAAHEGLVEVVVDPAQAFGTGAHPTTRLCIELLVELADEDPNRARGAFQDWGTGSGVLAITAAKLGFDPVAGCDHEEAAVEAARENGRANGVDLAVERLNLREHPAPWAATVTANMTAPVLLEVATRLERPPETLICSGLLASEVDQVVEAFAAHGLIERGRRGDGDWHGVLLGLGQALR